LIKKRIDQLLVDKKIAETRTKAKAMVMAGQIFVNKKNVKKSGEIFAENVNICSKGISSEWVSRGAYKLIEAINFFKVSIQDRVCLDIGASTGGFTQVLLKKGARKIYSVDVGKNQLHEKLIKEKKVINIEKQNARYLSSEIIKDKIDVIVCDVSFISLKKVIEPNMKYLKRNGKIISLIKPQFEADKKEIKKGIVIDASVHKRICKEYEKWFSNNININVVGTIQSPLKGPKGNIEFLIYCENYKNLKQ